MIYSVLAWRTGRDFEPPCFLPAARCPAPGVIILKDSPINLFSFISVIAVSNAGTVSMFASTRRWTMTLKKDLKLIAKTVRIAVNALMSAPQTPY